MKALIVDDSKITLKLLDKFLTQNCKFAEVISIQDSQLVIEEIMNPKDDLDLIILDWQMPNLLGIDILEGLRKNGYDLPIIMCTSDGNKDHILEAIQKGASEYIVKPIALNEFQRKVNKVMENYWAYLLKKEESKHVLVVDDQKTTQDLITKMLSNNEKIAAVDVASDGKQAINKYLDKNYDLVILDFEIPQLNGIEVTQKIRIYDQKTPILMLSSHTDSELKLKAFDAGVTQFISKPLVLNDFLYTVHQMVAISHKPHE